MHIAEKRATLICCTFGVQRMENGGSRSKRYKLHKTKPIYGKLVFLVFVIEMCYPEWSLLIEIRFIYKVPEICSCLCLLILVFLGLGPCVMVDVVCRSNCHLNRLQWMIVRRKLIPNNPLSVRSPVRRSKVVAIQIRSVTSIVPPGALIKNGTIAKVQNKEKSCNFFNQISDILPCGGIMIPKKVNEHTCVKKTISYIKVFLLINGCKVVSNVTSSLVGQTISCVSTVTSHLKLV